MELTEGMAADLLQAYTGHRPTIVGIVADPQVPDTWAVRGRFVYDEHTVTYPEIGDFIVKATDPSVAGPDSEGTSPDSTPKVEVYAEVEFDTWPPVSAGA